jgi:hypothetical protein
MCHCPLVVVRHNAFGLSKYVARECSYQEQVDDAVMEAEHRVVELHDQQILVIAWIPNDGSVCA